MKKRAVICLDGEPPSKKKLESVSQRENLLIAADGGANWLYEYGFHPDILIGDLDGIRPIVRDHLVTTAVFELEDQYSTDMEKTFRWCVEMKIHEVVVLGSSGKRLDHSLANFFLLWNYYPDLHIELTHDGWWAYPMRDESRVFPSKKGQLTSVIPYSHCEGLSLKGFRYPLTGATMSLGQVGVSNVALGKEVEISVENGRLLALFLQ